MCQSRPARLARRCALEGRRWRAVAAVCVCAAMSELRPPLPSLQQHAHLQAAARRPAGEGPRAERALLQHRVRRCCRVCASAADASCCNCGGRWGRRRAECGVWRPSAATSTLVAVGGHFGGATRLAWHVKRGGGTRALERGESVRVQSRARRAPHAPTHTTVPSTTRDRQTLDTPLSSPTPRHPHTRPHFVWHRASAHHVAAPPQGRPVVGAGDANGGGAGESRPTTPRAPSPAPQERAFRSRAQRLLHLSLSQKALASAGRALSGSPAGSSGGIVRCNECKSVAQPLPLTAQVRDVAVCVVCVFRQQHRVGARARGRRGCTRDGLGDRVDAVHGARARSAPGLVGDARRACSID